MKTEKQVRTMLTETQIVLDQMDRLGVDEKEVELYRFFIHREHCIKEILGMFDENGCHV